MSGARNNFPVTDGMEETEMSWVKKMVIHILLIWNHKMQRKKKKKKEKKKEIARRCSTMDELVKLNQNLY